MKILSGTSNPLLSKSISKQLKLKLINTNIKNFADGEIYVEINENIRGNSVFVVQSTSTPANDNLMDLLLENQQIKKRHIKDGQKCLDNLVFSTLGIPSLLVSLI